jgi:hypothetical protein
LSYNNRYGDLCFGWLLDRHSSKLSIKIVSLAHGSAGVPVIELDGYKRYLKSYQYVLDDIYWLMSLINSRTGPFEFFKFPIEVRHRIYRLLLGPFYTYDSRTKRSSIKIYFKSKLDPAIVNSWDIGGGQFDESEEAAKTRRQRSEHRNATHPLRKSYYEFKTYTPKEDFKQFCDNRDYLLVEWLRQASNVSCLFRKELGDAFWTNIDLQMNEDESNIWPILPMLKERPAIHGHIKSLSITLSFSNNSTPWETEKDFEVWCNYLGGILQLDEFHISLQVDERDFQGFVLGKDRFSTLGLLKKLQVTGSFNLGCCIGTFYVSPEFEKKTADLDEEDKDEILEELWEECKPRV